MYHVLIEIDQILDNLALGIVSEEKNMPINESSYPSISNEAVRKDILQKVLGTESGIEVNVHIRHLQFVFTALCNKTSTIIRRSVGKKSIGHNLEIRNRLTHYHNVFYQSIGFIRDYFYLYFDDAMQAPFQEEEAMKSSLAKFIKQVLGNKQENGLVTIIIALIEKRVQSTDIVTYKDIRYYRLLADALEKMTETAGTNNDLLQRQLFFLNCNDAVFLEYMIHKIQHELMGSNASEQLQKLMHYRKEFTQQSVREDIAMHGWLPSIKEQLLGWIKEEINYLTVNNQLPINTLQVNDTIKMQIAVSVSVLGCILKLLLATGIISNTNHSDVIRFFAKHFTTSQRQDISFDSLYNKYHSSNSGTISITKEILGNMTKKLITG